MRIETAKALVALVSLLLFPAHGAETVYFLVSERIPPQIESCIVPVTDPRLIAEARQQLELPQGERRSLNVRIALGKDWINRNYVAPGAPAWSWHVSEFPGFADATTWGFRKPSDAENYPGELLGPPENGRIFLGYYTVIAEFTPPVIVSHVVTPTGAELKWHSFGTNFLYTVETSNTAEPSSWAPAPGTTWPISTTNWVDTTTNTARRFYRIRGEPQ